MSSVTSIDTLRKHSRISRGSPAAKLDATGSQTLQRTESMQNRPANILNSRASSKATPFLAECIFVLGSSDNCRSGSAAGCWCTLRKCAIIRDLAIREASLWQRSLGIFSQRRELCFVEACATSEPGYGRELTGSEAFDIVRPTYEFPLLETRESDTAAQKHGQNKNKAASRTSNILNRPRHGNTLAMHFFCTHE